MCRSMISSSRDHRGTCTNLEGRASGTPDPHGPGCRCFRLVTVLNAAGNCNERHLCIETYLNIEKVQKKYGIRKTVHLCRTLTLVKPAGPERALGGPATERGEDVKASGATVHNRTRLNPAREETTHLWDAVATRRRKGCRQRPAPCCLGATGCAPGKRADSARKAQRGARANPQQRLYRRERGSCTVHNRLRCAFVPPTSQ